MNKALALLSLVSLAFAGTSIYLKRELDATRLAADESRARVAELETQLVRRAAPETARGNSPERSAPMNLSVSRTVEPPSEVTTGSAAESSATIAAIPRVQQDFLRRQREMMQDPEYRALMREQQKVAVRGRYPDLTQALGLDAERTGQLTDLLSEHQLKMMEIGRMMPLEARTEPSAQNDWQQRMEQQRIEQEAEIESLLGAADYAKWQEYQASLPARFQVQQLRNALADSVTPLRREQVEALVAAVAPLQQQFQSDSQKQFTEQSNTAFASADNRLQWMEDNVTRMERHNEAIRQAAAPLLSPEQLAGYDELVKQQTSLARINLRMMQDQARNNPDGIPSFVPAAPLSSTGVAAGAISTAPVAP